MTSCSVGASGDEATWSGVNVPKVRKAVSRPSIQTDSRQSSGWPWKETPTRGGAGPCSAPGIHQEALTPEFPGGFGDAGQP